MLSPTASYIACLIVGAALLLLSYPLHAQTAYWLGLTMVVLTVIMPNVGQVVEWARGPVVLPRQE